ncbi:carboxy terminal-processing peptidase [Flavobacteriaceae bacterium]|nr:carboxy terminal-processing peptidase [Flavobacteriaceae bacterium]MDA9015400.1 carboxy terminal-processing peptidase [Flavobacteriaceae bacterium]MDC3354025.1 carboxy terminal-processing peptidase [Flavobacteriaceae bacterium]
MRSFIWLFSLILVSGLLFGFKLKNEDPNKDKLLLEIISYVLERGHYSPKQIDDAFSENVYMDYLDNLDGQHRFFLQSDINSFESFKYKIDDEIKNSELTFFDLTYDKIVQRMDQVEGFYESILEEPFDFSKQGEIDLDFETAPYAANLVELKKLWRTRFKLNALQNFTSEKEDELKQLEKDSTFIVSSDVELEIKARENIKENMSNFFERFDDLKRKNWFSFYVNSMVIQFDPHTFYLAPSDKERFDASMSGKFEGIGARLTKKNQQVKIVEVISGGPVWRNELLEIGDTILKVGQEGEEPVDISGMVLDDAVKLIKGPKGTNVYLTIKRVDGTIEVVAVTRDVVVLEETYARSSLIKDTTGTYGLIELPKFYINFQDYNERNAATDVKKELEQLKKNNVKGIILDLRNNGGGSLKTVVDMTGYFIEEGPVVQVKSTGGRKEVLKDTDPSVVWDGPLVILVNEFSASASEILAAALQDYSRAIILGSKQTFGKGTVQNIIDLNRMISGGTYGDLGALKVTTDKFYRINGLSTQLEGVKSDIVFPDRYAMIDMGEKDQDNPLSWDRITPASYTPLPKFSTYDYSVERSKQRLKENPFVALIEEQAAWVKKQQDDSRYFLDYESFQSKRESNRKYADRFKKISEFESDLEFQWLPEAASTEAPNDDLIEKRERWEKSLKKDLYITEAVEILKDLSNPINVGKPIAQLKEK